MNETTARSAVSWMASGYQNGIFSAGPQGPNPADDFLSGVRSNLNSQTSNTIIGAFELRENALWAANSESLRLQREFEATNDLATRLSLRAQIINADTQYAQEQARMNDFATEARRNFEGNIGGVGVTAEDRRLVSVDGASPPSPPRETSASGGATCDSDCERAQASTFRNDRTGSGDVEPACRGRADERACSAAVQEARANGDIYRGPNNPGLTEADLLRLRQQPGGLTDADLARYGLQRCNTFERAFGQCQDIGNGVSVRTGGGLGGYGAFGAQQCSAIQRMISGCPNPFSPYGQQQCGGLLLMLNKCPQGSYNPYNSSNPYNYPTPTCSIQANPSNVSAAGQATTLQWQSQNASYATLSNSGQIGPSGSMTVYPQVPTTYVMTVVGYGNQQGRCETRVTVGGQGGAGGPQAQISCQPQTADVGMDVAIFFACQNSAAASGSNFSTGGALSGNATTTIGVPPFGTNTITYGLNCSNQGQIHSAQCTVNVNRAGITLVAYPKTIASGEKANIGWVTSGMEMCTVSSPTLLVFTDENASSTSVSGAVKTPALTANASFVLSCLSKTGTTKTATTTVTVQ
ncbi:MAG: hypothetical protein WA021_02940 [Minisyncoccia bacterium]